MKYREWASIAAFPAPPALYPVSVRPVQVSSLASFGPCLAATPLPLTVRFRFTSARWELSSQLHVMSDVQNRRTGCSRPFEIGPTIGQRLGAPQKSKRTSLFEVSPATASIMEERPTQGQIAPTMHSAIGKPPWKSLLYHSPTPGMVPERKNTGHCYNNAP